MAVHKQHHVPVHAQVGDAWLCPNGSFKRVLSRGRSWENVNIGAKHPDEVDHGTQVNGPAPTVSQPAETARAGAPAEGAGDDGKTPAVGSGEGTQESEELLLTGEEEADEEDTDGEEGIDGDVTPVI